MARGKELTLVAAAKPQLKKRAKRDWSKAKERKFLQALLATCNVSEAVRQSGVPMTVVYRRRKMDAGFRARWNETLAGAYAQLELVLLERAFNGTEKTFTRADGSEERTREYPNHIALRLLQMHRDTVVETESDKRRHGSPRRDRRDPGNLTQSWADRGLTPEQTAGIFIPDV